MFWLRKGSTRTHSDKWHEVLGSDLRQRCSSAMSVENVWSVSFGGESIGTHFSSMLHLYTFPLSAFLLPISTQSAELRFNFNSHFIHQTQTFFWNVSLSAFALSPPYQLNMECWVERYIAGGLQPVRRSVLIGLNRSSVWYLLLFLNLWRMWIQANSYTKLNRLPEEVAH